MPKTQQEPKRPMGRPRMALTAAPPTGVVRIPIGRAVVRHIGKQIRLARLARRWSLQMLCDQTGISLAVMSKIECGQQHTSMERLSILLDVLELSPLSLFPPLRDRPIDLLVARLQLLPDPILLKITEMLDMMLQSDPPDPSLMSPDTP